MTKFLIRCRDIDIGDVLFASSIAKKPKDETPWETPCHIDFDSNYLQTLELLDNNPYIDNVFYKDSGDDYTKIFDINKSSHDLDVSNSVVSQ